MSDLTFPMPKPDSGWSREITEIDRAQIWTAGKLKRIAECGVTTPDGLDCPEAAFYRGETRMTVLPEERPVITAKLSGTHMWGGQVFAHFGHFLCETLPRLWAASRVDAESIVFIGKHSELTYMSAWQERIIRLLGVTLPITFLKEPTEVERLLIPGQGFGLGAISRGTPEFREMLANIPKGIKPQGAEKIYISRTKTGKKGSILNELSLEGNLANHGYVPYHPQMHGVEEQLAQYLAATHIIGLDSSAFHLVGMVARPEQKIAIVLRRSMMAYRFLEYQLEGMMGRRPDVINALVGDWLPPKVGKPGRLSWGQIDHPALASELVERGYLDDASGWKYPTEENLAKALGHFRKRSRGEVVFSPVKLPLGPSGRVDESIARPA